MRDNTAIIFDVQRGSYVDGPGIRTTVFFKGCNLRCAWCHNPESHSQELQMMFYENRCTKCGKCKEKCANNLERCDFCNKCVLYCPQNARSICGKEYTVDSVLKEILKDRLFYENSRGGVTFSGGECMLQIDFLAEILRKCKECGIHTAIDTAGCVPFEYFQRVMPYSDLFLYDLKCLDSEKHRKYTGVDNELILANLERLLKMGKALWVRVPIIPSFNDTEEEMRAVAAFLDRFDKPEKIELMPYHKMGEHKYAAIGKQACSFDVPSEEKMQSLKSVFGIF